MNYVITKKNISILSVFLFLYYVYLSPLAKYFIPGGNIGSAILLFAAIILFIFSASKIVIRDKMDSILIFIWILISAYVFINNYDLSYNLIKGGMIHFYIMVLFLTFSSLSKGWEKSWIYLCGFFILIHAFATIIFYYNPTIYKIFAHKMYSGETLTSLMRDYQKGYMAGFCSHFSSNGMILGIGSIILYENLLFYKFNRRKIIRLIYVLLICVTLYATILTSKRAILLIVVLVMIASFFLKNKKEGVKPFLHFFTFVIFSFLAFLVFYTKIPGMDTIANKFLNLSSTDVGLLNGRESLWKIALQMFIDNPIFGKGYGSYYFISISQDAITSSAHNYYLQVLAELGLLGLLLYIIAFCTGIIYTIKTIKSCYCEEEKKYLYASLGIQSFVVLYSMTATSLMYYNVLIPYFIALSIVRVMNTKIKKSFKEERV